MTSGRILVRRTKLLHPERVVSMRCRVGYELSRAGGRKAETEFPAPAKQIYEARRNRPLRTPKKAPVYTSRPYPPPPVAPR